ncbi:SDR family NAD(P)-dependent oxidoreductase [Mycobacterium sp. 050134]|uniref:SDR family NAD(P)-dependent oxidoreductase n=1 Tax=Mycobacterium sp. 050134 TaxID=3096111 RepID=UPI002EDB7FF3
MQVAIVTGASGGIGSGCVTKLAGMGMAVLATGRNEARLAELGRRIGDSDRAATLAVDLTDDESPGRTVYLETDDESLDYFLGLMLRAAAFLCSPGGAFINGQTIVVDGGWSATKYLSERALSSEWKPR